MTQLTDAKKRKLQRLINASVNAHNAAIDRSMALNDFCEEIWGFTPGDMDVDAIIDACFGGCGQSDGFDADAFVREMNKANGEPL